MAKPKTIYYCQNCGAQHATWLGKCTQCGEWNTIVEEVVEQPTRSQSWQVDKNRKDKTPVLFNQREKTFALCLWVFRKACDI